MAGFKYQAGEAAPHSDYFFAARRFVLGFGFACGFGGVLSARNRALSRRRSISHSESRGSGGFSAMSNSTILGTILPHEFAAPIGYFTIWYSMLEVERDALIGWFMNARNRGTPIVLAHIESAERRLHILSSLANEYLSDELWRDEIAKIIAELRRLNEARNSLLHGVWYAYSPTTHAATKLKTTAKKTLRWGMRDWSPQQIRDEGANCVFAAARVQMFRRDLGDGVLSF